MGVAIRPSALMTTLAAPCIACFDRRLMVAAGPRILVRQRAMIESAESAAAAAETSRERRRATTRRRSDRDGLRATSRPRGQRDPRSGCTGDRAQQRGFGRDGGVSGTTRAFRMIAGTAPAWADVWRVITVPAAPARAARLVRVKTRDRPLPPARTATTPVRSAGVTVSRWCTISTRDDDIGPVTQPGHLSVLRATGFRVTLDLGALRRP